MTLEDFIAEKCLVHPKLSYDKREFYDDYLTFTTQKKTSCSYKRAVVFRMNGLGFEHPRHRYRGIGKMTTRNKAIVKYDGKKITSGESCKVLSCTPAQDLLEELALRSPEIAMQKNPLKRQIIEFEKYLHSRNEILPARSVLMGVLFAFKKKGLVPLTQREIARLLNSTMVRGRKILQKYPDFFNV